jgi:hypothetical protein
LEKSKHEVEQLKRKWEEERKEREEEIDYKAETLGLKGLYRLLLKQEELLERHEKALYHLSDGNSQRAYSALRGYDKE